MLSEQQLTQYQEDGYVIPGFQLPPARVAALRDALEQLLAANPGVRPEKLLSAHIEGDGPDGQNAEGVAGSRVFFDLARDPDILDMVAQVIGPDIILWGCHVFCKPGDDGYETPWHQDGEYWPIRPLATLTVWVAIDESVQSNGCLRVIPGSHRSRETVAHDQEAGEALTLNLRAKAGTFDEAHAVSLELQPGQMSLHDVYLLHGADRNTSGRRRAGVALRYMPASSVFERKLNPAGDSSGVPVAFATRPLWLLRGRDASGRNDFVVGHRPGENGLPGS